MICLPEQSSKRVKVCNVIVECRVINHHHKYNKGAYRDSRRIDVGAGGVERDSGNWFLVSCPENKRTGVILLPIIQRFVLLGTIIYTYKWGGYNGITSLGYILDSVHCSVLFVNQGCSKQQTEKSGTTSSNR